MDSTFIICLSASAAVFGAGIFLYRKGLSVVSDGRVEVVAAPDVHLKEDFSQTEEMNRLEALHQDALKRIEELTIESGNLRLQIEQERINQDKILDDYRSQMDHLKEEVGQIREDYEGQLIREQQVSAKAIEEKNVLIGDLQKAQQKLSEYMAKFQESEGMVDSLKKILAEKDISSEEEFKKPLQKSITMVKELKAENEKLAAQSKELSQKIESFEAANKNLQDKDQQLQYELVKSRAQILAFETTCRDLNIKIEALAGKLEVYEKNK